jgi:hypothetical protein
MKFELVMTILFLCTPVALAAPVVLQFENAPFPHGSRGERSLIDGEFRVSGDFSHVGTLNNGQASNTSTGFLAVLLGGSATVTRPTPSADQVPSDPDNPPPQILSPFNALAVDVAEYSLIVGVPATVMITGTKVDGSTVTASFMTDGVFDSVGGAPDFETFQFPSTFSDLVALDFHSGYSFDNVQVEAVPEPQTILWVGAAMLIRSQRRRVTSRHPLPA